MQDQLTGAVQTDCVSTTHSKSSTPLSAIHHSGVPLHHGFIPIHYICLEKRSLFRIIPSKVNRFSILIHRIRMKFWVIKRFRICLLPQNTVTTYIYTLINKMYRYCNVKTL